MSLSFMDKMSARAADGRRLCVGLDPVAKRIPSGVSIGDFCLKVVEATHERVLAYKPNIGFFEGRGLTGLKEYITLVSQIQALDSGIPIIGDWKRGDIGATNDGYIQAAFDSIQVDAITVHPFLGQESLAGFLAHEDKGVIVLCRTTNPGAPEFQDLVCDVSSDPCSWTDKAPLYQVVAHRVAHHWNEGGNCGLVVGATYPEELAKVREIAPDIFLLIPGVGTQGGDLEECVRIAYNPDVGADFALNVSGAVLYAYAKGDFQTTPENFAKAAAAAAEHYDEQIRSAIGSGG